MKWLLIPALSFLSAGLILFGKAVLPNGKHTSPRHETIARPAQVHKDAIPENRYEQFQDQYIPAVEADIENTLSKKNIIVCIL